MFFNDLGNLARLLIIIGLSIAAIGLLLLVAHRYLPWLGRLPGDVSYEDENVRIYFPLATMILISIIGTVLLNIVIRVFGRRG